MLDVVGERYGLLLVDGHVSRTVASSDCLVGEMKNNGAAASLEISSRVMPCRWTVPPSLRLGGCRAAKGGSTMSMTVFLLVGGHGPSD